MGFVLFAEYLNAIAVVTVSDAPELGTLTVTPSAGSAVGTTKATLSGKDGTAGNVLKDRLGERRRFSELWAECAELA